MKKEVNRLFKELPFYNALIEEPYSKHLNSIDMLRELPFCYELSFVKMSKAFKGYARNYEVIGSKHPSVQLAISRPNIKDLFKDLLTEIKGFKYQTTLKVLLSKYKENTERKFAPVYFSSTTKTVIGPKDSLDRSFR